MDAQATPIELELEVAQAKLIELEFVFSATTRLIPKVPDLIDQINRPLSDSCIGVSCPEHNWLDKAL